MRYLAAGFFILYLAGECLGWLAPPPWLRASLGHGAAEMLLQLQNVAPARIAAMPFWQRVAGLALAAPALGALAFAVLQLCAVLSSFERAAYFTPQVSRQLRRFTLFLLLGTTLTMLEPTLRSAVLPQLGPAPAATLQLDIDVNGSDLCTLLLCAVYYALAHIIDEGQRLAIENSEFG